MVASDSNNSAQSSDKQREVMVTTSDLPLACPRPTSPLWARHPRVFLDVLKSPSGEVACPYCGTRYCFTGERPSGHHD